MDAAAQPGQPARRISTDQAGPVPAAQPEPAQARSLDAQGSGSHQRWLSTHAARQAGAAAPAQQPRAARAAQQVPPWTPSRDRVKQGFLPRRMAFLTQVRSPASARPLAQCCATAEAGRVRRHWRRSWPPRPRQSGACQPSTWETQSSCSWCAAAWCAGVPPGERGSALLPPADHAREPGARSGLQGHVHRPAGARLQDQLHPAQPHHERRRHRAHLSPVRPAPLAPVLGLSTPLSLGTAPPGTRQPSRRSRCCSPAKCGAPSCTTCATGCPRRTACELRPTGYGGPAVRAGQHALPGCWPSGPGVADSSPASLNSSGTAA